jgi:signal transduction histidine kinase
MKAGGQLKLAARRCAPAEAASVATGNGNSVCFRSNQFDASAPHVEITVADDGQGIPKDVLPRILEPYFTTKPRGQGTGLGLAICVQLLDHYKGAIKITSQAGAGTTCALYLPLAE